MKVEEIVIIEDDETMRLGVVESLKREGYSAKDFENGEIALKEIKFKNTNLAIVDLRMEPLNGIEVLQKIKESNPRTEVLMISAYGTVDDAVKAMKLGAADFLTKPFSTEELRIRVKRILEKIQNEKIIENLLEQNKLLNNESFSGFEEMIGNSEAIKKIFSIIEQVAEKDSTVLICGESGTGKELVARAIHKKSLRSVGPFIKVNCGALNENLLESELFGHEKGSFTGAIRQKKGRFELADKGTLFLDEIGDISPAMQVKLLRVLQDGEFERVGGEEVIHTSVRIISATNKDLNKLIAEGKFREDLFYRLSVIPINLPPLRERREDIPALVKHFITKSTAKNRQETKKIDNEGLKFLLEYPYPGNIRELENLIERLCVITNNNLIEPELIARHLNGNISTENYSGLPLEEAMSSFEKNMIITAMKKSNGVKNQAAKMLGIKTSALYYKLEKYGLI
jgi:two-component system, NtrC family, response regulator HydG